MKVVIKITIITLISIIAPNEIWSHCEVPCGIYGDDARFSAMSEDIYTIEKAMSSIDDLAKNSDAISANQLTRWVDTKEQHANRIQQTVSQYFLTQRLKEPKTDDEKLKSSYWNKLELLHRILRKAMLCKQSVDITNAHELQKLVDEFRVAYNK
ncbi:MAG: superoxide dismutase [Ni] [Candidatus Latescibacterota bacterium]|nr:superoxide dismutase [Ni] [Candidatus Latescibacterota bacterium]